MKLTLDIMGKSPSNACHILGVYQGGELSAAGQKIDQQLKNQLSEAIKGQGFQGLLNQTLSLFCPNTKSFNHFLLVGCGAKKDLTPAAFIKLARSAAKQLSQTSLTHAMCYLTDLDVKEHSLSWKVKLLAEAASYGMYEFDLFKSKKKSKSALKEFSIYLPREQERKVCTIALNQGNAVAIGVTFAKNLGNTPSNICTPSFLAEQAKDLAKNYAGLKVKILNEKEMQKLSMGALLAVSQGSAEEAKLICLEYNGAKTKQAPIVLVGKGVTFDTGGNSLKPADAMFGMKYDMCGAATVLGVMKAIAYLKLPVHVVGVIPAVENMPGGTAYKAEDILTSMSGQTIEVVTTDAEGRLILADALTYCERYQPAAVIDIATLTGAAVIALGSHATALMSNDQPLTQKLLQAGIDSYDRAWELPLFDEYQDQIKSPFADMANAGGRAGGSITAGCFLSRFTKGYKWAHLDVAGTAANMSGTMERHATGRPVPLLMQYIIDHAAS